MDYVNVVIHTIICAAWIVILFEIHNRKIKERK